MNEFLTNGALFMSWCARRCCGLKLLVVPWSDLSVAVPSDMAVAAAVPNCLDGGGAIAVWWQKFPKWSGINLSVT